MKLYFSISQIPELAGLARPQRKAVYQCALEALVAEQPSTIWICSRWVFSGILTGVLADLLIVARFGLLPFAGWGKPLLITAVGGLVGAMIGIFIGAQWMTARVRPYLRRVLEERANEIAQIDQPELDHL
jgi:hypothetical protein